MKKIAKRCLALLFAIIMTVVTVGTNLPAGVSAASTATENPKYMAKLTGNHVDAAGTEHTYIWAFQQIEAEAGKTYTFNCSYYAPTGGLGGVAVLWSNTKYDAEVMHMDMGAKGELEASYTATEEDEVLYIRFEIYPGSTAYVWDVSLKETGSDENLLTNGDFSQENGSWIGWQIKDSGLIDTKEKSDQAVAAYGHTIMEFDSSLFEGTDQKYMAKLTGNHVDAAGTEHTYIWAVQQIEAEAGKTYTFNCSYYAPTGGLGGVAVLWSNTKYDAEVMHMDMGAEGKLEASYTATEEDEVLYIRFEIYPGSTAYVWDVSLKETGSDENLLTNGDFSQENGSWIGWQIKDSGLIDTKEKSDQAVAAYGHTIMEFDSSLFGEQEQPGDDTTDQKYMAKLTGNHVDAAGTEHTYIWAVQQVRAEAGKTYTFSCSYYVPTGGLGGVAVLWSNTKYDAEVMRMDMGAEGKLEASYTATEEDTVIYIRLEIYPGSTAYVWDVSLKEAGSDKNLLTNGDFSQENGSWIGWQIKDSGLILTKEKSDQAVAAYGHTIMEFDSSLFEEEELPGDNTTDQKYMAKLTGGYVDAAGTEHTYIWAVQQVRAEAGKTYTFNCSYYAPTGGLGGVAVLWSNTKYDAEVMRMDMGAEGKLEASYTATEEDTVIYIRLEIYPGSTAYVWDVSLKEAGSDKNLLTNGDFSQENGSWIGWQIKDSGLILTKEKSDQAVAAYGHTIMEFDSSLFKEEQSGNHTTNQKYMAKLTGDYVDAAGTEHTYIWLYQQVRAEAGKTYTFNCNYYAPSGGMGGVAVLWSNTKYDAEVMRMDMGAEGKLEASYTATKEDTVIYIRLEIYPGSTAYVWDVSLKETGSDKNLLTNGDFSQENGSWIGWQIKDSGFILSKQKSDEITKAYGHEILVFNRSLFTDDGNAGGGIPKGDPEYMAQLTGSSIGADGTLHTYVNVYQVITPVVGKTYKLSCNYYTPADGGGSIMLWSAAFGGTDAGERLRANMKKGTEGTLEITHTATEADIFIAISMECNPDATAYVWNFCLTEVGSNRNLLQNADFSKGEGSFIGWFIGGNNILTKATSEKMSAEYGHTVVKFDRNFINTMLERDKSLKEYENPNVAFSFDDVDKYKELDIGKSNNAASNDINGDNANGGLNATLNAIRNAILNDEGSVNVIWICIGGIIIAGLAATGIIFIKKKKERK